MSKLTNKSEDLMNLTGIIPIYKPKGPTSHDVIDFLRQKTGIKKIGHAGTLDPLASGVLVVAIDRQYTKRIHQEVLKEKEYVAQIKLGYESSTDDEEGVKTPIKPKQKIKLTQIEQVLPHFTGQVSQTPPLYSAVKINGQEAYKLARKGQQIKIKARQVEIKNIEILAYKWPILEIKVVTGPGVYIRSLARDIGQKLEIGAYLTDLERTRVGEFNKNKAIRLPELERKWK